MIPVTTFAGRTVALFGLGSSGLTTCRALLAGGVSVVAFDDDPRKVEQAAAEGVTTADLRDRDWSDFAALMLTPGVPLTHPAPHWAAALARRAGVEVIGDIELFARERARHAPDAPLIAITGTNGKSTTTALIAHLLRSGGADVQLGGNIGVPILALEPPAPGRYHVIEVSSFQIDLAPSLAPSVGVLLNLTPDHLDRHGSMQKYAAIKERLVQAAEAPVVGVDDAFCSAIFRRLVETRGQTDARAPIAISGSKPVERGYGVRGTEIGLQQDGRWMKRAELSGVATLRGAHNAQNAAAAAAVLDVLGLSPAVIGQAMRTYPGLPHRLEPVGQRGRVLFINDSKATNADSTEKALASFPGDIFSILGGRAKEGGIGPLRPYFPRIAKAYLIGAATEPFAATLAGRVPAVRCGTLDVAVALAAADAGQSDAAAPVVLLSPACASYDQFPNFEVRGNTFRDLVRSLSGVEPVKTS